MKTIKAWLRARRLYRIAQDTRLGALRRIVRSK